MKHSIQAIVLSVILLSTYCPVASGINLWELRVYEDKTKPAAERLQILYGLLLMEVSAPTIEHKGLGGGIINHDYTIAQIIGVLEKVARESIDAQAALEDKVKAEQNPEVKEAATVALAISGSQQVDWIALAALLRSGDRVFLRERTAYALSKARPAIAIPDLIDALQDSSEVVSGGDVGATTGNVFPVRRAAACGLREMGISVKVSMDMSHEVDREAAVKVLVPVLSSDDVGLALQALSAVERIGGETARQVLEDYIEINATNISKKVLVSEAQGILSSLNK